MEEYIEIGKLNKKKRPQSLTNIEKSDYFISGYNFYKRFMERKKQLDGIGDPMERVGVYCVVYSLMEDRLETLWWNYSYCNRIKVFNYDNQPREISEHEWENKIIPPKIRRSGIYLKNLNPEEWGVIDKKLFEDIKKSDLDRRELIHRNVFFTGDLKDKHINECVKLFRILDKMVQKHKRENPMIQR